MTPERWQQAKELFRRALEQKSDDRSAFLEQACNGDEDLRIEVESLLASHDESDSFIEMPVAEAVAEVFSEPTESLVGRRLGHHQVLALLGRGGMGEVYLAQDTRLNRRVALKVLRSASVSNQEASERFWREARAAATLDDPHICAIHEITEADGYCFIVMQFVEGETLAAKLKRERLTLREVVNVAVQVANALAVAHEANVIHRDIKPGNIIVNNKAHAKVLDFGLAKFDSPDVGSTTEVSDAKSLSKSGAIMGTVPFMSPEQVRGKKLDARTDIFSFGATLYEMSCGKKPFDRESDAEIISAILRDEPSWMEVPVALQPIVKKCLRKDVDARYQIAKEVWADLVELQRQLESAPDRSSELADSRFADNGAVSRTDSRPGNPRSIIHKISRHRVAVAIVLTTVLTAIIILGLRRYLTPQNSETRIETIAVLPLRSLAPETDDQYLGLAIADSIIAKISQMGNLTVRPTSAVRKYTNHDALQSARELHADAVLDGTYLRINDRLRITVNLLRVSDGASLWAETFDQRFTDIFAIQDEVSQQIAQRLRLTTTPTQQARLKRRNTSNPDAYSYYAKGMYHFYNISPTLSSRS
ncbi:MAG TPA: serine/threonine-protein kinase, partial [Pyrinomonadaceae bacterium]